MRSGWGERVAACAAVLVLVALSACGSSNKDASSKQTATSSTSSSSTSTTAPSPTTAAGHPTTTTGRGSSGDPRTPAQLAADKGLAQAANLELSDLPAGWKVDDSSDGSDSSDDPLTDAEMAKCMGVDDPAAFADAPVDESSPDFAKADAGLSSDVTVAPDAATARHDFQLLNNPKLAGCMAKFVDEEIQKDADPSSGVTFGHATTSTPSLPPLGEGSFALELLMPATVGPVTINVHFVFFAILQGRFEISVIGQNINAPVDTALLEQSGRTVLSRAKG